MLLRREKKEKIMIQPNYESYRFQAEICKVENASIVECRMAGVEIAKILAAQATVVPTECALLDGEIKYAGKLVLKIVYEDSENRVCRAERGAEFSHRVENALIVPNATATPVFTVENITHRREGSSVYFSVVVKAEFCVFVERQAEYLVGGGGLIVKTENKTFFKTVNLKGAAEADDEFEMDYVGDILMHAETAHVSFVEAGLGQITVAGEVSMQFCALGASGGLCSYERLIPFRTEILCEDCTQNSFVSAWAHVTDAKINVAADEEKGKCKVEAIIDLSVSAQVTVKDSLPVAVDAFSLSNAVGIEKTESKTAYCVNTAQFTQRLTGAVSLSEKIDYSTSLKAVLLPKAEISLKNGEAEGMVEATVILRDKEEGYKSAKMTLPFIFPLTVEKGAFFKADAIVCGLSLYQRKEGEAEAEATLKVTVRTYQEEHTEYIAQLTEGESFAENDSAISVYLPCAGDGLWETAKRLRRTPEELEKSNPELVFPLKGGERIFVYRQKN